MINSWIENNYLITVVLILSYELFFLVCLCLTFPNRESRRVSIQTRMKEYAKLKGGCECKNREGNEFEVLLGMLKKVEAKTTTMITVLVFALAAVVTGFFAEKDSEEFPPLVALLSTSLILHLFFSFVGMRQLDSFDNLSVKPTQVGEHMLESLINDLSRKELGFRFSKNCVCAISLALLLLIAFEGFLNSLERS